MAPTKLAFPLKSHPGRKKSLEVWCHPEEKLASQEEIPHSSDNLLHHLARESKVETMMTERTTPCLGLLKYIPCSLLKPNPHISSLKADLGAH